VRALRLGLLALLALPAAALARPTPPPPPVVARCAGARVLDVYAWPRGHAAIPSLGLARSSSPHVAVFRAGTGARGFLAGAHPLSERVSPGCTTIPWLGATPAGRTPRLLTGRRVRCVLAADALVATGWGGVGPDRIGRTLAVFTAEDRRAAVSAFLVREQLSLAFDASRCRRLG
jgi:hypothetical protein